MTEFLNKSFSVGMAGDQQYRDNWERIFGKKKEPEPQSEPEPCSCEPCSLCEGPCDCLPCGCCGTNGCICYTRG